MMTGRTVRIHLLAMICIVLAPSLASGQTCVEFQYNYDIGGHLEGGGRDWRSMAVYGSTLYVANRGVGVQVIDLEDPSAPVEGALVPLPVGDGELLISGGFLYAGSTGPYLYVLDLADPLSPVPVDTLDTTGRPSALVAGGSYLYATEISESPRFYSTTQPDTIDTGDGLSVYDLTDPAHPFRVRTVPYTVYQTEPDFIFYAVEKGEDLAVVADLLVMVCDAEGMTYLNVLDLSTGDDPVLMGSMARGDYAYLCWCGTDLYDLSVIGGDVFVSEASHYSGYEGNQSVRRLSCITTETRTNTIWRPRGTCSTSAGILPISGSSGGPDPKPKRYWISV